MNKMRKYHRALGLYGIIYSKNKGLVVIKKNRGPYVNRLDLPGGSLEDGEELSAAIKREINEETGLVVLQSRQIGITSFKYPWDYLKFHFNQHIAVFYDIQKYSGNIEKIPLQFPGQDSLGSIFMPLEKLNETNSSPLVLKAKDYLQNNKRFDESDTVLLRWNVLNSESF
ncbi:ADP-ribose pyrophosphatase [Fructobacillus tropaeoli]|uniref:ADP-ribose pyrophosphatase n=2 Tax=Fructobacillus tropaeoli TaxID=709323 RepID=A0A3F3H693_9LACO|nr:ADP-ribose pyrophosphatase [Fructobacillus tropaeoli]